MGKLEKLILQNLGMELSRKLKHLCFSDQLMTFTRKAHESWKDQTNAFLIYSAAAVTSLIWTSTRAKP